MVTTLTVDDLYVSKALRIFLVYHFMQHVSRALHISCMNSLGFIMSIASLLMLAIIPFFGGNCMRLGFVSQRNRRRIHDDSPLQEAILALCR